MNNPDFEVARVALSEAVALMAEGCPRLAGYQVDLARVAINAGLEREKGGDLKNNTPGGAGEGQPVKGDTAKDGGRVLDEYCLSCGSRFDEAYMCACDIQESLSGCKACGGTGEVLAEECGVCRENY